MGKSMREERSLQTHANDHANQYVAVLLELYLVERERRRGGPMDRTLIRYWRKVVASFEKRFPQSLQGKLRYRVSRAEGLGLGPLETALVRYAWSAFLSASEDPRRVVRRWEEHLTSIVGDDNPVVVPSEVFEVKRRLREAVRGIREAGLWPWPGV
jgi:hypothetical protein